MMLWSTVSTCNSPNGPTTILSLLTSRLLRTHEHEPPPRSVLRSLVYTERPRSQINLGGHGLGSVARPGIRRSRICKTDDSLDQLGLESSGGWRKSAALAMASWRCSYSLPWSSWVEGCSIMSVASLLYKSQNRDIHQ